MLTWCSYCQQFQGEVPPYEDLSVTHGICARCEPGVLDLTAADFAHARMLQRLQSQLMEAGRRGDVHQAVHIITDAVNANVRAVDVLMGIVAPLLYRIGKDWENGVISVAEEHRFTKFCERVYKSIVVRIHAVDPGDAAQADHADVLLVNAPGNTHTLAVRILALWLANHGVRAWVLYRTPGIDDLVALVARAQPRALLLSMALAEQRPCVVAIAERIAALPGPLHPRIIVGGNAVKLGLVSAIPGAELMTDISQLPGAVSP